MKLLRGALLLALATVAGAAAAAAAGAAPCPQPLRIGFNEAPFPPSVLGAGPTFPEPPGWAVQAAREVVQRLGCSAELVRLPGRRLARALEQGDLEFAVFFGPTAERLQVYRYPLNAAGRPDPAWAPVLGHVALFGLPGSPALKAWAGATLSPGVSVGVVGGSTEEALARDLHWPVEVASGFDTSVLALRARRFDLLLMARESLSPAQLTGPDALVELMPIVEQMPYFVPAGRSVHKRHPDFVSGFWREFCHAARRLAPEARGQDCGTRP